MPESVRYELDFINVQSLVIFFHKFADKKG